MSSQDIFAEQSDGGSSTNAPKAFKKKRQRKQTSVWSAKENVALVCEVKKYECIWNPVHKDYKNGKLKKTLWKSIQATKPLNIRSARECCDRWGVMRTAYKRKLEQKSKSRNGASAEELVLPEPFCRMKFLLSALDTSKSRVDEVDDILPDSPVFNLKADTSGEATMDLDESLPGPSTPSSPPCTIIPSSRRTPSSVNQKGTFQRDVLPTEAMKALRDSDEWFAHFAVSISIIQKAVTEFPDMERQFRREIMQFNIKLDTLFEDRQAQQMQVIIVKNEK